MTDKRENPLRLEPPVRHADAALGERLALLARGSTPTQVRRRVSWRAPLAGLAIVVGTGGLAYGAQSVAHHIEHPSVVVPGSELSPSADASSDSPSPGRAGMEPSAAVGGTDNPSASASTRAGHGLQVGKGHAKGKANAPGRNGTAPGKQLGKSQSRGKSSSAPGKTRSGQHGAQTSGKTQGQPIGRPTQAASASTKQATGGNSGRGHGD